MALKNLKATDRDRLVAKEMKIEELRELLRDVYDVTKAGERISDGLFSRIRAQMARGRTD